MSVISPLADDLALVYSPLLPAAFYQLLKARGITLVEGDAGRVRGLQRPQPQRAADRAARGHRRRRLPARRGPRWKQPAAPSNTFEADALCIACEGGPTCLTRPVLQAMNARPPSSAARARSGGGRT